MHHLLGRKLVPFLLMLSCGLVASAADEPILLPVLDGIGGDFSAPSTLDREVSLRDYRGKAVLLFFGYTSCQDVCPVTLAKLSSLTKKLGPDAEKVQVLFVTVDPETDTVEHLVKYLARFDASFVGLTGTKAQVASIARLYLAKDAPSDDTKVTTEHHKAETYTDESFLYAHSQQIYLLDLKGRTRALYFTGSPVAEMAKAIRSLLN